MDILQIYQDFNVPHQTEGHKHCRPGWVNTACPFCTGNPGLHLGASLDGGYFYCWRCGAKHQKQALSKLLSLPDHKVADILREYGGLNIAKQPKLKIRKKAHKYPSNISPLQKQHIQYLKKRNFDPAYLEKKWLIKGTGPSSMLDGINYSHRILIPIYWYGQPTTFQARDITDRHMLKYMACPKERELEDHKHILYGNQNEWGDTGICVEGVTDVWRLGDKAFCTFGIEYTNKQVRVMAKQFKRIAVVFDDDPQAVKQANKIVNDLLFRGVDAFSIDIKKDPGSMSDDDAAHLIKSIL